MTAGGHLDLTEMSMTVGVAPSPELANMSNSCNGNSSAMTADIRSNQEDEGNRNCLLSPPPGIHLHKLSAIYKSHQ